MIYTNICIFTQIDYASDYISDTISTYYSTYWRGPYITTTDDVVEPSRTSRLHPPTTTNGEPVQVIVVDDELVNQVEQIGSNVIIDGINEHINGSNKIVIDGNNYDDDHGDLQPDIQLNLDNYLLLHEDDDDEGDKSISE